MKFHSQRLCANCNKVTTFQYEKALAHSRCMECGGFKVDNFENFLNERIREVKKEILTKLKRNIIKELDELRNEILKAHNSKHQDEKDN